MDGPLPGIFQRLPTGQVDAKMPAAIPLLEIAVPQSPLRFPAPLLLGAACLLLAGPLAAGEPAIAAEPWSLAGYSLGIASHDTGPKAHEYEDGWNLNGEMRFLAPRNAFFETIFEPRLHLGGSINSNGNTDYLYGGLTWQFNPVGKLFIDYELGLMVHDGNLDEREPDRLRLGSRVLIRNCLAAGIMIDDHNKVGLVYDHMSHQEWFADANNGLETVGIRWYRTF